MGWTYLNVHTPKEHRKRCLSTVEKVSTHDSIQRRLVLDRNVRNEIKRTKAEETYSQEIRCSLDILSEAFDVSLRGFVRLFLHQIAFGGAPLEAFDLPLKVHFELLCPVVRVRQVSFPLRLIFLPQRFSLFLIFLSLRFNCLHLRLEILDITQHLIVG
jgi:hypothetical protein